MKKRNHEIVHKMEKAVMKILVVDENALNRKIICSFIKDLGYEVTCFETPSDLKSLHKQYPVPFDLILLDPQAPKGKSHRIVIQIHELYPGADIVIMSEDDLVLAAEDAIKSRVYSYLKKPFRLALLELMLARVNEKRGKGI